ncbi:hypothetical protein EHEL_010900 [Encephalitozoon hellem ATCC 50504]|uniref:Uncharacterized protein n=1 Tax=Encephalitozoon hellem TaxID=27973 RepID=A0A9Q9C2R9_ENCHE|nr:uncharacterized protein EHEL_010900 [Encephalitozoon hellem ATCC 50504]AFM97713.1 hypothetical protein EHEL_010900 [Encephalitozoon hellem ATCC 50504]UTX42405.1 hypothetical protein GPU96_01g01080 [Encephalitozoon hellem]|eukprot:XP_003886694.1 hypothetical protein EHEL_010900 [Encephalitozoon hellem ATCC 50504]
MESPGCLRRQAVLYSVPLLLVASHFPGPYLFVLSIPSSLFAFLIPGTKRRMYISNLLFILSLLFPGLYFLCYGFTIAAIYVSVSNLCMGRFRKENLVIAGMMESMGMLLSLYSLRNNVVSICLAALYFLFIHRLMSPPIESDNYGQAYKKIAWLLREASFTDRANEYREVVGCRSIVVPEFKIDLWTPLLMGRLSCLAKAVICCSSLIPIGKSYWMSFVVYSLSFLPVEWACMCLSFFCDFGSGHPFYRLVSAQALYLMTR